MSYCTAPVDAHIPQPRFSGSWRNAARREAERGTFALPIPTHPQHGPGHGRTLGAARRRAFPGFLSGATCQRGCAETHSPPIRPHYGVFAELRPESATYPSRAYIAERIIPIGNPKPHDPTGTFPVESRQTHEKAPRSAPNIWDDRFIGWREKRVRGAVRGQYGEEGKIPFSKLPQRGVFWRTWGAYLKKYQDGD